MEYKPDRELQNDFNECYDVEIGQNKQRPIICYFFFAVSNGNEKYIKSSPPS